MKPRHVLLAAACAVAGLATPAPDASANHCSPVFMFSGVMVAGTPRAANAGAVGCVLDDEQANTNYLTPGANVVSVASLATPVDGKGTLLVDGTSTELRFTWSGTRWNSQWVSIPVGRDVTAKVTSPTGVTVSSTYRAVA